MKYLKKIPKILIEFRNGKNFIISTRKFFGYLWWFFDNHYNAHPSWSWFYWISIEISDFIHFRSDRKKNYFAVVSLFISWFFTQSKKLWNSIISRNIHFYRILSRVLSSFSIRLRVNSVFITRLNYFKRFKSNLN